MRITGRPHWLIGVAISAAIAGSQVWIWTAVPWYPNLAFADTGARLRQTTADDALVAGLAGGLWITTLLWVIVVMLAAIAIEGFWERGWRAERLRGLRGIWRWVCGGSAVLAVLFACVASVGVERDGDALAASDAIALTLAVIGQLMWFGLFATVAVLFFTLYGTYRFRCFAVELLPPTSVVKHSDRRVDIPKGAALCLSGGGIRSASFCWGALAELERHRDLDTFSHLYSVSGGGYAASALTGRRPGVGEDPPFFGGAQLTTDVAGNDVDPGEQFTFVKHHRRYLRNGYGGVERGLMFAVSSIVVNFLVIFGGIVVVGVPIGILAGSELGVGTAGGAAGMSVRGEAWWPGLLAAAVGVMSVLGGAVVNHRRAVHVRQFGASLIVGAGIVVVVRCALPWLAMHAPELISKTWWRSVIPASILWIGSFAFAIARPRLTRLAVRLGGIVTLLAVVYGMIVVVRETMDVPRWWLLLAAVLFLGIIDHSGVQWWSLHPLYRDRLAATFLMKRGDGGLEAQHPSEWIRWSDVPSDRRPLHVICAATHRGERDVTGLRSTSFTFSCEGVKLYNAVRDDETGAVSVSSWHRDAAWFEHAVGASQRRQVRPSKRASVIAATAISGAAFNSAMGSSSLGSTDSLLALLNLRLGVWLPNPRFDFPNGPLIRPGLRFLFNEVTRFYDLTEPFIHVSDGGHWENLGLVEALRSQHRHIVCIDASGDRFHEPSPSGDVIGLGTLFKAIDLARIELFTEVRVDPAQYRLMRPDVRTGRCEQNWMTADIVYHRDPDHDWRTCTDCPTGRLLFVKAMISDRTEATVLAFANEDRVFPHYPTSDQFLEDGQFRALVGLGETAMRDAWRQAGTAFMGDPTPIETLNQSGASGQQIQEPVNTL